MLSMTGFGKKETLYSGRTVRIEIKSVNQRFLDVNFHMPRFLLFLEDELRNRLKARIARGRVDVFINYISENDERKILINFPLAEAYYKGSQMISQKLGISDNINVIDIMKIPDVISFEEQSVDDNAIKEQIFETLDGALNELIEARIIEGNKLERDIRVRLEIIECITAQISSYENSVVDTYRDKLKDRLNSILTGSEFDDSRIAQEIAIYADKCNITEELVRIRSHIERFVDSFEIEGAHGRNLDFLIQEFNREFNTIGSKCNSVDISNLVISAKAEIEKIREQIQNIE